MNRLVCAGLIAGSIAVAPRPAAAFCHLTTVDPTGDELCSSTGRTLAWFDRCSTVALSPRRKSGISREELHATLQKAFDTWNEVRCDGEFVGLVTDVSDADANEDEPRHGSSGGNQNVVMFVDSEALWRERINPVTALGLTSVFHSKRTGQIVGADMEINDWRGPIAICGRTCPVGVTDLENVLTHEAGHYYGLGHVGDEDSDATMYFRAPPQDVAKRDLAPDDVDGLCDTYPPGSFHAACTGSVFADMYKDEGCGCSTVGRVAHFKSWWLALPLLVLAALRVTRRQRRTASARTRERF